MINVIEFGPGSTVPAHSHPHEQLGIVLRGMQALVIDGVAHELGPMEGYVLPGRRRALGVLRAGRRDRDRHLLPGARGLPRALDAAKPQIRRHNEGVSQTIEAPVEVRLPDEDDEHDHDRPWIVIVWNDPINLMSYVTFVLRKLFGFSEEEATKLMLQVHNDGKAVVSSGEKEKAEFDVARLHAHGSLGDAQAGLMAKRSIKRDRKGGYTLHLPPDERELLRSLPAQFREVLQTDDPSLRRLFPPAYTDDDDANDEFQRLMREELLEGKLAALEIVEQTAGADHLTGEQLEGWLGALESLRLFLGTQLDVSEEMYAVELDPDDPSAPALALYGYLSWLQEQAVEALSAGL